MQGTTAKKDPRSMLTVQLGRIKELACTHNRTWGPSIRHLRTPCLSLEVADLCFVLGVGLLADFKTPEFDKYKGSSYPRVHLAMYCRKIAVYIYDDKVLIDFFQDSLIGATLSWYVSLGRGHIKTWRDLVEAFLK
ncbi:hypothetical protein CR513_42246, partial [Mucuna pruriens]